MQNMKLELLVPAKDKETAIAAINAGADAIYIGASSFGARKSAGNSLDDIKEVVEYAHKFWTRVHITLNTILTDSELNDAINLIYKLSEINVDDIIVQDFGILEKLLEENAFEQKNIPEIHMSTQCDNYKIEKIKFLNNIGISRVILARELSVKEIQDIHQACPNLALESFIHGALCVSRSGQCYLSEYIGGRSANRGECAQPCRKKYSVVNAEGKIIKKDFYPLCLKDFNASEKIQELIHAGISSFKIEGRLKDVGYVKNLTAYYRKLIPQKSSSGISKYSFEPNPEKSFNRGFTKYFLNGREECFSTCSPKSKGEFLGEVIFSNENHFALKTNKKISAQDGLYFEDNGCLVNKVEYKNNIVIIYPQKKVNIKKGVKVFRNYDKEFEKQISLPIKRQIGLDLFLKNKTLTLIDEDKISIEININSTEKANDSIKMRENFIKQISKTGNSDFYINNIEIEGEIPFMTMSEINNIRRNAFQELMQKRIDKFLSEKKYQKRINYSKYYQNEVSYKANIHNNAAKQFYEKCGAQVNEMSLESTKKKNNIELMRCKHCIKYALNMCKSQEKLYLQDSEGKTYPLKFDCKNCEMYVLSN